MMGRNYTSIRVSRESKDLLEKALLKLESKLGRGLDYNEFLRILARSVLSEGRKLWLLKALREPPARYHPAKAAEILASLRRGEDERLDAVESGLRARR
jgi:hypothetical protein